MYTNSRLSYNNYLSFKVLFFIIFIFPFIMHIYWGLSDILYANNIMYISFFLLIGIFIFNIYENHITPDLPNSLKYIFIFYIFIFYFLFTKYMHKKYYILFIKIVTIFVIINLIFYVIALFDNYYVNFNVNNLNLLTDNSSFILRQDWNYALPFYLSVIPSNSFDINQRGLLGLPRLFGMSTEPTLYNMIILLTIFMSLYYKKYFSCLILAIAFLSFSSFGAIGILIIATIFVVFYRHKLFIMANKSGEILSPIFLFYISFLYTEINNINNQKSLVFTQDSSNSKL